MLNIGLQRKARGQELLDMICQSMNLLEKDYFGLIYEDRHDPRNWLDLYKRITKFIKSMGTVTKLLLYNDKYNSICRESFF